MSAFVVRRDAGIKALKNARESTEAALRDAGQSTKERHEQVEKARHLKLAEASKQFDELVKRENEEVEKAKTAPPDLGRYLLSTSKPPIRPLKQQTEDEDDEKHDRGDPDDGWTPDPNSPFSNALYYYGSERWHEARAAFEEALQKTELSQHGQTENRDDRALASSQAVAQAEAKAAPQAEAEAQVEHHPETEPSPGPGTQAELEPQSETQHMPAPAHLDSEVAEAPPALGEQSGEDTSSDFRARCHNGIGLCWMMENRFSDGLESFNRAIAADSSAPAA